MRLLLCVFISALLFSGLPAKPVLAEGISKITDLPLNTYVNFAGARTRIDKIETVARGDGRPILQKSGGPKDTGYIIVTVSMQNPSATENISVPGQLLGFELADGTQIDENTPDGYVLLPSLNDPPDQLHPKQHIQVAYVIQNWNGQAITKMFLKNNSGGEGNDSGYKYGRFAIPKGYVTALEPVPLPSPSPDPAR